MKKLLIVFLLFASLSIYGQFNTGSVYFTGMTSANLGLELSEGLGYLPYNLNVEGGYFIRNRLSLGGTVHSHGQFGLGAASGSHELFLGVASRYYMPREEGIQIYYIANPFISVATGQNRYGALAGAGLNYFLTERIALEARVYYEYMRYVYDFGGGYNVHSLGVMAGISIFFPSITFFSN